MIHEDPQHPIGSMVGTRTCHKPGRRASSAGAGAKTPQTLKSLTATQRNSIPAPGPALPRIHTNGHTASRNECKTHFALAGRTVLASQFLCQTVHVCTRAFASACGAQSVSLAAAGQHPNQTTPTIITSVYLRAPLSLSTAPGDHRPFCMVRFFSLHRRHRQRERLVRVHLPVRRHSLPLRVEGHRALAVKVVVTQD